MRGLSAFAWPGLCTCLATLCIVVWLLPVDGQIALRWQARDWIAQPWTLWTAGFAHLSDQHLLSNMLVLLCLGILGQRVGAQPVDTLALILAWPLIHLSLLLWPQIQFYAGFSGLNHALAGIVIARGAINSIVSGRLDGLAFLLAALLLTKLIWEAAWAQPLRVDASWGFTVVQAVHLTGVACALLATVVVQAARIFMTKAVVE